MLNVKEQKQLNRLLEKSKQPSEPLTEKDLEEIDNRIDEVYNRAPSLMGDGMTAYNNFCKNLEIIVNDNDKLVREVRRLNAIINSKAQ